MLREMFSPPKQIEARQQTQRRDTRRGVGLAFKWQLREKQICLTSLMQREKMTQLVEWILLCHLSSPQLHY